MTDTFSKEKRSEIMRQVKSSRNKSTELKLIAFFKSQAIKGWRRNYKLFGRPDVVLLKTRTAIFVDGCFWHGHNCRNTKPKDNKKYWDTKISKNIHRDKQVTEYLIKKGWLVIRIWECELKKEEILMGKLRSFHNPEVEQICNRVLPETAKNFVVGLNVNSQFD
jgi:DNA mismatch endonuclease (patch repair protein)